MPIVSDTGAMPRIISDTGVVVRRRAPDEVEAAVRAAIDFAVGRDPEPRVNGSLYAVPRWRY
ncbi:MAG: hypothetical protein IPL52_11535 [Flavobacteriales bacterium]|nr:hypothetical protein [Flavobacteriales bacterium]